MSTIPAPAATLVLALVSVILFGSCATTGSRAGDRAAVKSLGNIEAGMNAYHDQYGRWPANVGVLQNFAAQRGRSLDMSPFSKFTISRADSNTVLVRFTTQSPDSKEVVFATTRTAVK